MRMIPPVPFEGTRSSAERHVFALLAQSEAGSGSTAYHSLNLSEHDYKVMGEIDFVVLSRSGLMVLEVKGGRVRRKDGIWYYKDGFDVEHRNSEGPFNQAKSAMYSLRRRLIERFSEGEIRQLSFGYGVVMPDTDFEEESVEWSAAMLIDGRKLRGKKDMTAELSTLTKYWANKNPARGPAPTPLIERIGRFLRPDFDRVPSLANAADSLNRAMERLTDEQYQTLDFVSDRPRIICEGGAGTGKTFLAAEMARRHAAQGDRVLLTCRSKLLAGLLENRLQGTGVVVKPFEEVKDGEETFDVLLLDEGQDLVSLTNLAELDTVLDGGFADGVWRIFLDRNNQAAVYDTFEEEALELLESFDAVTGKLKRNCRNTTEIVLQTRLLTEADLGQPIAGHGPPVEYEFYADEAEETRLLAAHLTELLDGGADPGSITVLSPTPRERSSIARLPAYLEGRIKTIDLAIVRKWPSNAMTWAMIQDFKGLENSYVALVDLQGLVATPRDLANVYVGMSRARAGVWMALPKHLEPVLDDTTRRNLGRVLADLEQHKDTGNGPNRTR